MKQHEPSPASSGSDFLPSRRNYIGHSLFSIHLVGKKADVYVTNGDLCAFQSDTPLGISTIANEREKWRNSRNLAATHLLRKKVQQNSNIHPSPPHAAKQPPEALSVSTEGDRSGFFRFFFPPSGEIPIAGKKKTNERTKGDDSRAKDGLGKKKKKETSRRRVAEREEEKQEKFSFSLASK